MKVSFELRPDQIEDLSLIMNNNRWALLNDPGTGKTPPVCVYFWWLWDELKLRSSFIMPKSLLRKNQKEILRFTDFDPEDVVIVSGTPDQRLKRVKSDAKVFLYGFSNFSKEWATLLTNHPDIGTAAVDEIHMGYGHDGSQRTQQFYKAMRHIPRFVPMTGTLINGRLDSVYPTINLIEPRYYGTYHNFMAEHEVTDFYGARVGWQNHEKLGRIFATHASRRTFEEIYGPEAKKIIVEKCQLSPKQEDAYRTFEKDAILELERFFLDGTLPGVHTIRCRQIMQCPELFGLAKGERTGKDELLEIHLADAHNSGEPLVIFSVFIPEQERIFKRVENLGMKVALINSKTSEAKRGKIDEDFQNGKLQVVVASPQTAAVGFNWDHVNTMVFVSMDYQDSSFFQAYRRAIRGVRKRHLLIYILEYEDTVDQRLFWIIDQKSRDAQKVDPTREVFNISGARDDHFRPGGNQLSDQPTA